MSANDKPNVVFDVEQAVLAAAIENPDALPTVLELPVGVFYVDAHQRIWEAIRDLDASGGRPETVALAQELRKSGHLDRIGGAVYLAQLVDQVPYTANVDKFCDELRARAAVRRLKQVSSEISELGSHHVQDPGTYISDSEAKVLEATDQIADSFEPVDYKHLAADTTSAVRAFSEGQAVPGIPTGLNALDGLSGGLRAGELWYVAGRPGAGKSSLISQIERGAVDSGGCYVISFNLELPRSQVGKRALSQVSGVALKKVRSGQELTAQDWERLTEGAKTMAELPIRLDDTGHINVHEVRSRIRRYRREMSRLYPEKKLGLVTLDYVQLMAATSQRQTTVEKLEEASRNLKLMAKEFDCCFMVGCQLNRENTARTDKRPTIADLKGAGALEQDADNVLFPHREDNYRADASKHDGTAELILAKGRDCGTGLKRIGWEGWCVRFVDEPPARGSGIDQDY